MNRTRRNTIAALVAAAALTLTACGGSNDPITAGGDSPSANNADDKNTPNPDTTGGPEVDADENGINWCKNVDPKTFKDTGNYSAEEVADAYCELITFNGENGFTNLAINDPDGYSEGDLAFLSDGMTPAAFDSIQKNYAQTIKDLKAGKYNTQAQTDVTLITAVAMNGDGYTFPKEDLLSTDRSWTPANYEVNSENDKESGAQRLFLSMSFTDTLLLQEGDGKPFTVDATRKMEYAISPSGTKPEDDHTWRIDGYSGKVSYGDPKPYKG